MNTQTPKHLNIKTQNAKCFLPYSIFHTPYSKNAGFTLVETLVSLSIFVSAVVGMILVTAKGVNDTNYSKNKIIATSLSQEGIEIVRNLRDSYALSSGTTGWSDFVNAMSPCMGNMCGIDPKYNNAPDANIISCSSPDDCVLGYDSATGYYEHNNGDSPYSRTIIINQISSSPEILEVISTASWRQGSSSSLQKVESTEYLMPWFVQSL